MNSIHDITKQAWLIREPAKDEGSWRILLIASSLPEEVAGEVKEFTPNIYRTIKDNKGAKALITALKGAGYGVEIDNREDFEGQFSDIFSIRREQNRTADLGLREAAELVPQTEKYVELNGGSASLCCFRDPAEIEVFNDMHGRVTDFFRVLRHPDRFGKLFVMNQLVPLSLGLAPAGLKDVVRQRDVDRLSRAYSFYRLMREPLVSRLKKMSEDHLFEHRRENERVFDGTEDTDKLYRTLRVVDDFLPDLHGRIGRMQIEKNTWQRVLEIYDSEETLFWSDPEDIFDHSEEAICALFDALDAIKGQVAVYHRSVDFAKTFFYEELDTSWKFHALGDSGAALLTKFR
jgi:hypothetical protein